MLLFYVWFHSEPYSGDASVAVSCAEGLGDLILEMTINESRNSVMFCQSCRLRCISLEMKLL